MANLIAFDSQYTSDQVRNLRRAQHVLEEAIRTLKNASAHEGWKCPENKNIHDSITNITSKLTRLDGGMTGTAEALNNGLARFEELETRAENQASNISSSLQNQYGTQNNGIKALPFTLIPFLGGMFQIPKILQPKILGLPEGFIDQFVNMLKKYFPYFFNDNTTTTDTTNTPAPAPEPEPEPTPSPEPVTLTEGNFDSTVEFVFASEGGFSDDPDDPGGATNMGITHTTLDTAYQRGIVSHNDVTQLTVNEAKTIYREMYWEPSNADKMPDPLATIYFDTVVLCGQYGGGKLFQRALNNLGQSVVVDGSVGPQTLAAMNEQLKSPEDVKALCNELCNVRQSYHESDVNAWKYLTGWTNRVERMRNLGNSYAV